MDTKQWNNFLNESLAACDMSDVFRQADDWLKQGVDYWKACGAFASSYAIPQTWLATAEGVSKTAESYMKEWTRISGLGRDEARDEALAVQKLELKRTDEALAKIKKEKAALKRSLTQKEKTLKAQSNEMARYQKQMNEKEEEIRKLQAKVRSQAEQLILLESSTRKEATPVVSSKKGATVPHARK